MSLPSQFAHYSLRSSTESAKYLESILHLLSVLSHYVGMVADPKTVDDLLAEHFASVSRKDPTSPWHFIVDTWNMLTSILPTLVVSLLMSHFL